MSKDIWHSADELPPEDSYVVVKLTSGKCEVGFEFEYDFDHIENWAFFDDLLALETELERTRRALGVAVDALKEQQRWFGVIRVSLISHLNNEYGTVFKSYDADPTVVNVKRANDILNTALEQITALEQKDVK